MNFEETTEAAETSEATDKKKGKGKLVLLLLLTLVLVIGASVGFHFAWQGTGYLVTDNARVTTALISVTPTMPGRLERFVISEGCYVQENEIIGWVENDEAMRSPVNARVIHSGVVQGQIVSPMEPVAVMADMNRLHVLANIEETDILRIQLGQNAVITIDPFGNRQFFGYVSEIGQITAAELTGNAMFFNTGGTFTRVTHLIPVKINIIDDIDLSTLVGVNARVRIPLRQPVITSLSASVHNSDSVARSRNVYTTLGLVVDQINVEVGDRITAGQVLAALDNRDLTNSANAAEASLRIAEINLAAAEHNHEAVRILYSTRAIPSNDLRQSEFALQTAAASRGQAQAMFDTAQTALERSVIRAPISGTVTAVFAREGGIGMGRLFVIEEDNVNIHSCEKC
ncbi:MAG: efflux RND transporter periplasmic adaptor subunit [Treponema sp.]|nr:efflux RND transporter periplasmic adaptor subunit [Treponema sp.]